MTSRRPRDVDGGWAWVVLLAAFMNLLIGPGLAFVGGIFQTVFLEHFQESVALTAWVTSLFASFLQLAGPASSFLSSQFSCRVSVMTGAILLAVGLFVSSFVHSIHLLLVFMGIVGGVGLGLTYSASVVVVNLYFVKMRTFVTGLALSASGAGCMVLPLLCRHLLDVLSWREAIAILAGISLQMVICGALMFPVHETNNRTICFMCLKKHRDSKPKCRGDDACDQSVPKEIMPEKIKMLNEDTVYNGDEENCSVLEIQSDSKMLNSNNLTDDKKEYLEIDNSADHQVKQKDVSLFSNTGFLLLCFHLFLSNSACGIFLIHFPAFAQTFSVSPTDIAFAMAMNGPCLTVSRILLGALGNDERIDPLSAYIGVLLAGGVVIFVTPVFATTASTQIATMALLGLYFGGSYSFLTAMTIDCVGLGKLAAAFGWEMICAGSGYLVAPPIAGWVVDTTGYYSNSIYLSGGLLYVSVFVILLVPVFRGRPVPNPLRHPNNITVITDNHSSNESIHKLQNDI